MPEPKLQLIAIDLGNVPLLERFQEYIDKRGKTMKVVAKDKKGNVLQGGLEKLVQRTNSGVDRDLVIGVHESGVCLFDDEIAELYLIGIVRNNQYEIY